MTDLAPIRSVRDSLPDELLAELMDEVGVPQGCHAVRMDRAVAVARLAFKAGVLEGRGVSNEVWRMSLGGSRR